MIECTQRLQDRAENSCIRETFQEEKIMAGTLMQRFREQSNPGGEAALLWLGQMGLLIRIGKTVLCVDYYASDAENRRVPPPIPAEEMGGVDLFLGTHDHLDHIDHEAWKTWAQVCPEAGFVFPEMHRPKILADGIPEKRALGIDAGGEIRVGEISIRAIAAAHEFLDRDPATGRYPCLQYIIEGGGFRIYHAGDTVRYEGMLPLLREFGPLDVALLPINGRDGTRYRRNCIGNMTYQEAADLAGELSPRLVIPGHWDMFADNSADPRAFADYLDAKYEGRIPCLIPEYLKPILMTTESVR